MRRRWEAFRSSFLSELKGQRKFLKGKNLRVCCFRFFKNEIHFPHFYFFFFFPRNALPFDATHYKRLDHQCALRKARPCAYTVMVGQSLNVAFLLIFLFEKKILISIVKVSAPIKLNLLRFSKQDEW